MLRLLKFTLDLFDVAPVYEPTSNTAPPSSKRAVKKAKKEIEKKEIEKKDIAQNEVTETSTSVSAQADIDVFSRHPKASQQTRLAGHTVDYELLRSRRRTMTFSVSNEGLSVRAPYGMPQHTIEAAVQEKGRWIVRKLNGMQQREERAAALKMDWLSGATLDYLGQPLQVRLSPEAVKTALIQPHSQNSAFMLQLALPATSSEKKIRDATQKWLIDQATQHYTARMNHYAPLLGVVWQSLRLSSAHTRWGSAKADGSIRLHWRLIQFSPQVIDYVVAHELSHLRELNHSPRFWSTLASVMPDYEAAQQLLKASVLPPWE
jgi:predicted metal-dependent hydrolase